MNNQPIYSYLFQRCECMMKRKATLIIQYVAVVYVILYIIFIIYATSTGLFNNSKTELTGIFVLLALFIAATITSWYDRFIAGLIFFASNAGLWLMSNLILASESSHGIFFGIPLIVFGAFFILKGIDDRQDTPLTLQEKWKIILQSLMVMYLVIYLCIMARYISPVLEYSWNSMQGLIIIINIFTFIYAFILSWRREGFAGLALIINYLTILYLSFVTDLFINGEYIGLSILAQAGMYLYYCFALKKDVTGLARYKINLYNLF